MTKIYTPRVKKWSEVRLCLTFCLILQIGSCDDILDRGCVFPRPVRMGQCDPARVDSVQFFLFTEKNVQQGYPLKTDDSNNLNESPFVLTEKAQLKILIHGINDNRESKFPQLSKNVYLSSSTRADLNIIIVDWKDASDTKSGRRNYADAVSCTPNVAEKIVNLLKFLIQRGYTNPSKIHVIGHSLGAQVTGMVGQKFGEKVARLSGLDPARPCFRKQDAGGPYRIQKGNAQFVDIIHTDGTTTSPGNFGMGLLEGLGDVDFYANTGSKNQPGCHSLNRFDNCSHLRAYFLFVESIQNSTAFIGRACDNYKEFKRGNCDQRDFRVMGESTPLTPAVNGSTFYFQTGSKSPFGMGSRGSHGN